MKLISELQFATKSINKQTRVDNWNVNFLNENLAGKDLEDFCYFEHVNLDGVREVNQ